MAAIEEGRPGGVRAEAKGEAGWKKPWGNWKVEWCAGPAGHLLSSASFRAGVEPVLAACPPPGLGSGGL